MKTGLGKQQFGQWALVTGASSGIGKEFARQVAAAGINVEQCVFESLSALRENHSRIVPGRLNRIVNALMPPSVKRTMMGKLFGKAPASRTATARAEAR
jgi:short-subunit dehydrogenase